MAARTANSTSGVAGLLDLAIGAIPFAVTAVLSVALLVATDRYLKRRQAREQTHDSFTRPLVMLGLTIVAIVALIVALPHSESDDIRPNLITLLGIAVTAVIALASTTFISNAMAGLLIRSLGNFKPGDFIRVNEHFGRVTERGLFHTEIQTEQRDLSTIPNFYLTNNTVTVVRSSGTIISAEVSLGYDVPEQATTTALIDAANRAELADPFVHVRELGDFSVLYRVSGFLEDPKSLISTRAALRKHMLHALHDADIEIASPNIMIQRPQDPNDRLMPETGHAPHDDEPRQPSAERVMFDKAERAELLETMRTDRTEHQQHAEELAAALKELPKDAPDHERNTLGSKLKSVTRRIELLDRFIESHEQTDADKDKDKNQTRRP